MGIFSLLKESVSGKQNIVDLFIKNILYPIYIFCSMNYLNSRICAKVAKLLVLLLSIRMNEDIILNLSVLSLYEILFLVKILKYSIKTKRPYEAISLSTYHSRITFIWGKL